MADFKQSLEAVIRGALEQVTRQIAEEEISAAKERVERRIRERLAILVMEVLRQYEVHTLTDRVVITVRNKGGDQ